MIKVFIIVAETLDGFIARDANQISTAWSSDADKKRFRDLTKQAGVVVMGSTTYKTIGRPLKDRINIVYSGSQKFEGTESFNGKPEDLLKNLEERGFKEVAICGGSSIYTLFAKAGLVEKIYLTVEPVIFGKGISIFNEELDLKLELVEEKKEGDTLFLEYKVLR